MNEDYIENDMISDETGVVDERPILSLSTDDRELIGYFKRWSQDSISYWNKVVNLDEVRRTNEKYYLGKSVDKSKLYDYQVPYEDNQIFVGVQSVIAYVSGQTPRCEIVPENDETQSEVMADDLEQAVNTHSERHKLEQKVKVASKNIYIKRIGVLKLKWDSLKNDIVPVAVDPNKLILDKDCDLGEEPRFIMEKCSDSVAELFRLFPDKKEAIKSELGRERVTPKMLGQVVEYNEVWFTDEYAEDQDERECVAWYFGDTLLDKSKNPNYLYSKEGLSIDNFLDAPTKPYVFFNYLNDGSSLIDQTSPLEQAIPLQDVLNKRGRQIVENADTANSLLVLKSGSISDDEANNITRDPNQILMLDTETGQPIQSSFGEIAPHLLPNYVLQDKQDLKQSIHNILGTPSQFRGSDQNQDITLGQSQMIKSQASGRQDEIVREIENGMDRYFRLLVQMMKVYYTEKMPFSSRDNDGKFIHVELSRESMPHIAHISVSKGSLIKPDKQRKEDIAMGMAKLGLIDPYNLFKDLGLTDADKRYESLVKFKTDPTSLVAEITGEIMDKEAYIDFALILNGQEAEPRQDIKPAHILAHREQLLTDRFLFADSDKQQALLKHIEMEVMMLSQRAKLEEADAQGMLIDPNVPITPEPPELPPPMPPMGGGMGIPPEMMMGGGGMPPMPPEGMPMGAGGGVPPVGDMGGVLSGLIPNGGA